jgi:Ca2+-binding RTX toxin-like protein
VNRKLWTITRLTAGLTLLGAAWFGGASAAQAQCAASCNQSAHHWNLGATAAADDWYVGMVFVNNKYLPARCSRVASPNQLAVDFNFEYPTKQLTANASLCMGGGADRWTFIEGPVTCLSANVRVTLHPIDLNGRRLTISGESGNDTMTIGLGMGFSGGVGQHAMCGGTGNDRLFGGYDKQLIFGGADHDYMGGDRQDDEVRAGAGQDVILHPSQEGTDLLVGEGGEDCMYVNGPTQAGSTCTAEFGVANFYQDNGQSIAWCDWSTPNCCALSPAC